MADVTTEDRGQLLLVGGLSLAVVLVALVLILNSAIYTENLATRGTDAAVDDALEYRADVVAGVGGAVDYANRDGGNTDYATKYAVFEALAAEWSTQSGEYAAVRGVRANVDLPDETAPESVEGAYIAQDTATDFTDKADRSDWWLARDVKPRQFRMVVERPSLVQTTLSDITVGTDPFTVRIVDANDKVWEVYVYSDGDGNVRVAVQEPDGTTRGPCVRRGDAVTVDLSGASVDGRRCGALEIWSEIDGPVDVRYVNVGTVATPKVTGTYQLTVDRASRPLSAVVNTKNSGNNQCSAPTYHEDPANGNPYLVPAIYSTEAQVTYEDTETFYRSTARIAPNEPGEPADHPVVVEFTVTDDAGSNDAEFTVGWRVIDPNGDFADVTVELVDSSETTIQTESSTSESGTVTFADTDGDDNTYDIRITATDASGNQRTVVETHLADNDDSGCPP